MPSVVRGPGVPKGKVDKTSVYSLTDLAATILHVSGAQADFDHDGAVMPLTHELRKRADWNGGAKQFHLSEYWVENVVEGKYAKSIETGNATYRGVRVVEGDDIDYAYAVWCTNEHEIYDMKVRLAAPCRPEFSPAAAYLRGVHLLCVAEGPESDAQHRAQRPFAYVLARPPAHSPRCTPPRAEAVQRRVVP